MAETVDVPFTSPGLDGISAGAEAAAAATAKLDAATANLSGQLSRLQSDYDSLEAAAREASDPSQFIQMRAAADKVAAAMKKVVRELALVDLSKSGAKDAAAELKKIEDAARRVANEEEKAAEKAKELGKAIADTQRHASDGRVQAMATAVGNLLAEAAKKAVELGIELTKALAESVIEASRAKQSALGLLQTYEGADKAAAHYAKLSGLAKQLGVDANALVKDFAKFHHEVGLSESASVALLKLKADVEAIAPATGQAEKAAERFIYLIKGGMSQEHALKTVADEFHAAGSGADAAAAKLKNPAAAIDALKVKGTELAAKLADKLGPKIIETADKFAAWLGKEETIAAIERAADSVAVALDYVVPTIELFAAAVDRSSTSSTGMQIAGSALAGAVNALVAPFRLAYDTAVLAAAGFTKFTEVQQIVIGAVDSALTAVSNFASQWTQAGADLVAGFIAGIEAGIDAAVAAATSVATAATDAAKKALKIKSPSQVFEDIGGNVSAGFAGGLEPVDVEAGLGLDDAAGIDPSVGGSGGGGTYEVTVNINVSGAGGIDMAALEMAARNAVYDALTGVGASGGVRTRGATT